MLFNSWQYVGLLVITGLLYWLSPVLALRQAILLLGCLIFYAAWNPIFVPLLVGVLLFHWAVALWLDLPMGQKSSLRKEVFVGAIALSIAALAYFKYTYFFLDSLTAGFQFLGLSFSPERPNILLPLGISFYTFHSIAYTADVYSGRVKAERNPFTVILFVAFFPQLIAGPICRATELLPQLKTLQPFRLNNIFNGLFIMLAGFFLKSCIADSIAPYANVIFDNPENYGGYDNLMGAVAFSIQIYGDFCGYSLMAVGSAMLFGYLIPFNFNLPYIANSLQNFWRRWHITLSSWLRDYLYIPLGGSRQGEFATYRNLLTTMILGGIWHGASWTFFLWGVLHGFALAAERLWMRGFSFSGSNTGESNTRGQSHWLSYPLSYLWTFSIVVLSWIFFRASSVQSAWKQIAIILTPSSGWFESSLGNSFYELVLLFIPMQFVLHRYTAEVSISDRPLAAYILFPVLTLLSIVYYTNSVDFIYFQF
jgi:alginate O-acetyltransferase complex protein AlgI